MKALLLVSALFAASFAQAEVKPLGTFVPTLCTYHTKSNGPVAAVVAVKSVCVGKLSGMNQEVVKLSLNTGEEAYYAVKFTGKRGGMGVSKAKFSGMDESGEDKITGTLITTSGITVSYQIQLKTKSNLSYSGNLKAVFTTM